MFCIQIEIAIGIGIEKNMTLGHEKLDVYRLSIGYVAWVYEKADSLNGVHRPARDQWLRARSKSKSKSLSGSGSKKI
ncbi:MAG: hypothetical protein U5L07_13220 [Desulfobacterales bacterium]|nr:hypothetical protein [Desulfobacterales bacterium]